jgi:hypothetical protein
MVGDSHDVFALLAWLDTIHAHQILDAGQGTLVDFWSPAEKNEILKIGRDLFEAFRKAVKEHKEEHKIGMNIAARNQVCSRTLYALVQSVTNKKPLMVDRCACL